MSAFISIFLVCTSFITALASALFLPPAANGKRTRQARFGITISVLAFVAGTLNTIFALQSGTNDKAMLDSLAKEAAKASSADQLECLRQDVELGRSTGALASEGKFRDRVRVSWLPPRVNPNGGGIGKFESYVIEIYTNLPAVPPVLRSAQITNIDITVLDDLEAPEDGSKVYYRAFYTWDSRRGLRLMHSTDPLVGFRKKDPSKR